MIRRPPRSTQSRSSAASDVYKRQHLAQFRIGIAALALLSGLVLNGLTAWWLLRLARRSAAPLFAEYRLWAIGAAVLIVALPSTGVGYLTHLGMRDPRRLPDTLSMVVATFMLLLPLAVTFAGRRMAGLGGIIPVDEPAGREKLRRTSPSGPPSAPSPRGPHRTAGK